MTAAQPLRTMDWPAWIGREWLFWICLTIWAFLPESIGPWVESGGLNYRLVDVLIFAGPLLLSFRFILQPRVWLRPHLRRILGAVALITLWAAFSLFWSEADTEATIGMLYTLLSGMGAAALAYLLIQERTTEDVSGFLWRLTLYITATAAVYFAESFFGLGLRSAAVEAGDFGIARVRGPLFESSTGFFLLIPCLAYVTERVVQRVTSPVIGILLGLPLLGAIFGLGSRAGLLLLALFFLLVAIFSTGVTRLILIVVLASGAGVATYLIFSKASSDRLTTIDAREGRLANHATSWKVFVSRGPAQWIFGAGYGSLWPWYATEAKESGGDLYLTGAYVKVLPEGPLIYHSHSTYLVLWIELGLPGLLITFLFWKQLLQLLLHSEQRLFAAGILVTAFALAFDLFLFRRPTRDVVWWIYLFGAFALRHPAVLYAAAPTAQREIRSPA